MAKWLGYLTTSRRCNNNIIYLIDLTFDFLISQQHFFDNMCSYLIKLMRKYIYII